MCNATGTLIHTKQTTKTWGLTNVQPFDIGTKEAHTYINTNVLLLVCLFAPRVDGVVLLKSCV